MPSSPPAPTPRPDWYPDPRNPALLRYWDGRQWTSHTAPRPAVPGGAQWSTYAPRAGGSNRGERKRSGSIVPAWAVMTLVLVLGAAVVGAFGIALLAGAPESTGTAGEAHSAPVAESSPSQEDVQETSTPEPTATEPPKSVVPRLTGLTREKAENRLSEAGLGVSRLRHVYSAKPPGTVLSQSRKFGLSVLSGTELVLVIAKPYPRVPGVVGRARDAAVDRLKAAGFTVTVTKETRTSGKDGVVLRQTPSGSARAKPGSSITIVISSVVRPIAPPPPPQNCTAGYDPCLPPAYDYDCSGGSGDGPEYTGYVIVTGSDPYDLDADGDGQACE